MKLWLTAAELAGLPGLPGTADSVTRRAAREGWAFRPKSRGKGREYPVAAIPPQAKAALAAKGAKAGRGKVGEQAAMWAVFDRAAQSAKDEAARRLAIINRVETFLQGGLNKAEATEAAAREAGTTGRTVRRWMGELKLVPRHDWLAALLPRYQGGGAEADVGAQAWEMFKGDYLSRHRPALKTAWWRTARAAEANGWAWPSAPTVARKLRREIPREAIVLARFGPEALDRLYPSQERDHSVFAAMEAVNGDGYTFNHYVRFPDGSVEKPHGWFWQDILSGKLLAFRLDQTENRDLVRLALGDMIEKYGIPSFLWIDNTMAAASKWLTGRVANRYRWKIKDDDPMGIIPQLGIKLHFTTPARGQAKPIERAFGVGGLSEIIDRYPGFAGKGTKARPIPLEEFRAVVEREVEAANARQGRRGKALAGRSFDDAFNESFSQSEIRKATAEQRRLCLLAAEGVRANRETGHIRLYAGPRGDNRYWSPALSKMAGHKVIVRFDPQNLHSNVYVYALSGQFICEAECLQAAGFADSEAARSHHLAKNRWKKAHKKALEFERRFTALEAAERLPEGAETPPPSPSVVRPMFGSGSAVLKQAPDYDEAFERGVDMLRRKREEERIL